MLPDTVFHESRSQSNIRSSFSHRLNKLRDVVRVVLPISIQDNEYVVAVALEITETRGKGIPVSHVPRMPQDRRPGVMSNLLRRICAPIIDDHDLVDVLLHLSNDFANGLLLVEGGYDCSYGDIRGLDHRGLFS